MKTSFTILELECQSCALMIESLSEDHPGVKKAEVNGRQRVLVVEHDEPIEVKALTQSLAKAGYKVKPA